MPPKRSPVDLRLHMDRRLSFGGPMIFVHAPSDFCKSADIVACFVEQGGRFLMLLRQDHKPAGNLWGLPAGKADEGEGLRAAMCRELAEETGLSLDGPALSRPLAVCVRHQGRDFEYHMFSAHLDGRAEPAICLNPDEHKAWRWVTPAEALALPLIHDQAACTRLFFGLDET